MIILKKFDRDVPSERAAELPIKELPSDVFACFADKRRNKTNAKNNR